MNSHDWAAMADLLELQAEAFRSYVTQAAAELADPAPRRVLDIGSGPGVAACALAAAFPEAEVVAVDGSPELLARAEQRARRLGVRLRTQATELPGGLAGLEPADLIWASRVVHHLPDQQDMVDRLARLLRPGGVLAVVEGGLPIRVLPTDLGFGRPGLQTRIDAATAERFNQMRAELDGAVQTVTDWGAMLRQAGLTEVRARSYLVDRPAPLDEPTRRSVRYWLERHRTGLVDRLDATDLATLDRLLDPDDPAGVERRADLFVLTAETVHLGRRPRG